MLERPIFLLGMPRSGTTWLSQVFEAHPATLVRLSPNFSYALKGQLTPTSTPSTWREVLGAAASSDDAFLTQDWRRQRGDLPRHQGKKDAQHLVIKDTRYFEVYRGGMKSLPDARCLFVVRNPCAALNSWMQSAEFPSEALFLDEWLDGQCRKTSGEGEYWGFEDWCLQARLFLDLQKQNPKRFRVFPFEEMVRDPAANLKKLFAFVGMELTEEVLSFVKQSHASHEGDGYSVFKDPRHVLDRWRETFPAAIAEDITKRLAGTDLETYLRVGD
ncbi:MAG: sulfotransferase family protein [Planctomycetota bacterium]